MSVRDRGGRNVIRAGDEVSVLSPQAIPGHDGVGIVTALEGERVTVTDADGRAVTVAARDVSVDWTDYPPE